MKLLFALPMGIGETQLRIFDILGRELKRADNEIGNIIKINRGELGDGIYLYRIEDNHGNFKTGKIIFE